MNNFILHDKYEKEFFEKKTISSLKYLIENGRELEFKINNHSCFISKYESKQKFSLWIENHEQSFYSFDNLAEQAKIDGILFSKLISEIEIITLF